MRLIMVMIMVKASLLVSKKLGVVGRTINGKRNIYSRLVALMRRGMREVLVLLFWFA